MSARVRVSRTGSAASIGIWLAEAAVVGVPDAYRGESVKAYISLRPGAAADPAEIIAYCKERLAAFKYPREIEVLGELPKTATGKILRRELKATAG